MFSCVQPSSTAFTGTGVFTSESPVNTGPIISDITELAQSDPVATEEWVEDRQVSPSLIAAVGESQENKSLLNQRKDLRNVFNYHIIM